MTLDRLRPLADRAMAPAVSVSVRLGVTPATVSVVSLLVAGAAALAFVAGGGWYVVGAVLVFANGWLDLLDGRLARRLGVDSPAGDLLDHVIDRYADVVILAGLAAGLGRWGLGFAAVTGVLLTSYLGTQAEAVGLSRVYGGLVGRADRLALIAVAAVLEVVVGPIGPALPGGVLTPVGWLLVFLAVVGHLTAVQRFFAARGDLA